MLYYEKYLENLRLNSIIFDDEIMDDIEYPETKEYVFSLEFLKKLNFRVSMSLLVEDLEQANVVLAGIPYDEGCSCGSGASLAPSKIRELSSFLPPLSI